MVEVMQDQLPKKITLARELLCMPGDDQIITVLRHYNWSQLRLEDNWFEQQK